MIQMRIHIQLGINEFYDPDLDTHTYITKFFDPDLDPQHCPLPSASDICFSVTAIIEKIQIPGQDVVFRHWDSS